MNHFLAYLHFLWCTHKKLFEIFKDSQDYKIFFENLSLSSLEKYFSIDQAQKIFEKYKAFSPKKIDACISNQKIFIVSFYDEDYPEELKNISHPPFVLYIRWKKSLVWKKIAVIGSRLLTPYAKRAGEELVKDLGGYFTIVSGWAGWCDTLAHRVCVENNFSTIVVFGTWIDGIYPKENYKLFEDVIEKDGSLVSIFPFFTPWSVYTFPVRNEIVAWLSQWVLVLQAGEKSGTLITAQLALEQGKDIFTIPGDMYQPHFIGNHSLIKNSSASLITSSKDILELYQFAPQAKVLKTFSHPHHEIIYNILKYNISLSVDELCEKVDISYQDLLLSLWQLELSGEIKKDFLGKYGL